MQFGRLALVGYGNPGQAPLSAWRKDANWIQEFCVKPQRLVEFLPTYTSVLAPSAVLISTAVGKSIMRLRRLSQEEGICPQ